MAEEVYQLTDQFGATMSAQMNVDGVRINTFNLQPEVVVATMRNIKHLKLRDDDVLLCTHPKNGTHWTFEIMSMLLNGNAEHVPQQKLAMMLSITPQEALDEFPSPRVLNTHLMYHQLPEEIKQRQIKTVVVLRNPKDAAVSFYHHHKGLNLFHYSGTFAGYLPWFMEGNLEYNSWFDYTLGMEKAIHAGETPMHLIYFEDLKENGVEEIRRLATFLGVTEDEDLFRAIHSKTLFDELKVHKSYDEQLAGAFFKPGFNMFRKGQIGDWKNHFTVAQNEEFDQFYKEKMKDSKLKFRSIPSVSPKQ